MNRIKIIGERILFNGDVVAVLTSGTVALSAMDAFKEALDKARKAQQSSDLCQEGGRKGCLCHSCKAS